MGFIREEWLVGLFGGVLAGWGLLGVSDDGYN